MVLISKKEDLYALVERHAKRLGISDIAKALANALWFAYLVGLIENNGKLRGKNPHSTAKGLYQFVDPSVGPARRRLGKYGYTVSDGSVEDMSWEEQTGLFLGDMLEKHGSDKYMRKILGDRDQEAMLNAYLELHHTRPDEATIVRAKGYFYGTRNENNWTK